MSEDSPLT